jgi:hypothetical protein
VAESLVGVVEDLEGRDLEDADLADKEDLVRDLEEEMMKRATVVEGDSLEVQEGALEAEAEDLIESH